MKLSGLPLLPTMCVAVYALSGCTHQVTPAPSPPATPSCPFELAAVASHETHITYLLDGEEMRATVTSEGDNLSIVWPQHDRSSELTCHPDGLRLVTLDDHTVHMRFTPGVLVLPAPGADEGQAEGDVAITSETGSEVTRYTHAWQQVPAPPLTSRDAAPVPLLERDTTLYRINSALVIQDHAHNRYSWQTTTDWAQTLGLLIPISRTQIYTSPVGETETTERAIDVSW